MDGLLELPDLPANAELLAWLREQADQPSGPDDYVLGDWQLHTHPDLMSFLVSCAPGWPLTVAYGIPILASKGVAAVAAIGTDFLAVRTHDLPPDVELFHEAGWLFLGREWRAIWAWAGAGTIPELIAAALEHAGSLGAQLLAVAHPVASISADPCAQGRRVKARKATAWARKMVRRTRAIIEAYAVGGKWTVNPSSDAAWADHDGESDERCRA